MRYGERYNVPTWRRLVKEKMESGEKLSQIFLHIKYPTILAFYTSGYGKGQVERLKTHLREPCSHGNG